MGTVEWNGILVEHWNSGNTDVHVITCELAYSYMHTIAAVFLPPANSTSHWLIYSLAEPVSPGGPSKALAMTARQEN